MKELNHKVKRLRAVRDTILQFLRDKMKALDQAFDELKEVKDSELDVVYEKIVELNLRIENLEK